MTAIRAEEEVVEEFITVPSADGMNDETFRLHMNKRHMDSLATEMRLIYIDRETQQYITNIYRAFHKRLHELRIDLAHDHRR